MGPGLEIVRTETLRDDWSATWRAAAADRFVQVNWFGEVPVAVMVSVGMWRAAQVANPAVAVPDSKVIERTSSAARIAVAEVLEDLETGHHTVVLFHGSPRAVVAPYGWVRRAFPELGLAPVEEAESTARGGGPEVLVVYRKARTDRRLAEEFADAADPVWEADRRLSSLRGPVPVWRRPGLRAVVYVVDGRVARVRAVEVGGVWEDLPGSHSLAPVSEPLSRSEIDARFPSLGLYPGDERAMSAGPSREYLGL
ncbi:hypothetical protein [Nocardia sp. alder85J]|uniref:hypothetical protein n=1 Tax=Nocardia sp. alder85J TaxID=2862949 RepID=UPI001CD34BAA|nr:hypothetical protein [Nocardia sp. alder85J]MCX4099117.1 hypothetical protein [Nocardia sp. alder85J]